MKRTQSRCRTDFYARVYQSVSTCVCECVVAVDPRERRALEDDSARQGGVGVGASRGARLTREIKGRSVSNS